MTSNQIAYFKARNERDAAIAQHSREVDRNRETERHNRVGEVETERHNRVGEVEVERHNRVSEHISQQQADTAEATGKSQRFNNYVSPFTKMFKFGVSAKLGGKQ